MSAVLRDPEEASLAIRESHAGESRNAITERLLTWVEQARRNGHHARADALLLLAWSVYEGCPRRRKHDA